MTVAVAEPRIGKRSHTDLPFMSVIVPTYNRAGELPYLFEALAAQRYPAERMEVLVVDDGSTDDTQATVARWAELVPFSLRAVPKVRQGPPAARNHGARGARGDVLAFTDSDCLPEPLWLRSAAAAIRGGAGIVCGPLLPVSRAGEGILNRQQEPLFRDRGCYPTANLFVRRDAFEAVGGFDEQFGFYRFGEVVAGEDADLAWRLRRSGERVAFVWGAAVRHLSTPIPLDRFLLKPLVVQIVPRLLPKVPELRATYLWHGLFLNRLHELFYLGVLALLLAAATRSWLPAVLVLPWAWAVYRATFAPLIRLEGLRTGGLRSLAYLYMHLGSVATLLWASIRYRRVVL